MAAMRSLTERELPRRMAWRVMIPKKISTMFSYDPAVGVKCMVTRAFSPATCSRPGVHRPSLAGGRDSP
jgi:hypothetical protein